MLSIITKFFIAYKIKTLDQKTSRPELLTLLGSAGTQLLYCTCFCQNVFCKIYLTPNMPLIHTWFTYSKWNMYTKSIFLVKMMVKSGPPQVRLNMNEKKNSRPLFTIIFRPKMLILYTYSILST